VLIILFCNPASHRSALPGGAWSASARLPHFHDCHASGSGWRNSGVEAAQPAAQRGV